MGRERMRMNTNSMDKTESLAESVIQIKEILYTCLHMKMFIEPGTWSRKKMCLRFTLDWGGSWHRST